VQRNPNFSRAGLPGFTGRGPGSTPIAIANRAGMTVTSPSTGVYQVLKTAGVDAYNASAVSAIGLAGDFTLRVKHLQNGNTVQGYFAGMNADPLTDDGFAGIDRAWNRFEAGSSWNIYENGAQILAGLADATYCWMWRRTGQLFYGRGATFGVALAAPDRQVADANILFFDSTAFSINDKFEAQLVAP
jgi:hypothetical protein